MKKVIIVILVLVITLAFALVACNSNDKIQIGLVVTLTGSSSEIGVAVRDGLLLRVEQVNSSGGINGKEIELIIRDDTNNPELITSITENLIDDGVDIILGYELSSKMNPMLNAINGEEVIVFSPTMSTYEMSGIDDNFFRSINTNFDQGKKLGSYASSRSDKTLIVYDVRNEKFAIGMLEGYQYEFDGETDIFPVNNLLDEDKDVLESYKAGNFDSMLFVMNPNDVMHMSQVFFSNDIDTDIYSSNWGLATNAFEQAGKAIEGAIFISLIGETDTASYIDFRDAYFSQFKKEPEFPAMYMYESALILFDALSKSSSLEYDRIKDELVNMQEISGVVSPLILNSTGDIERDTFLIQVIDGSAVLVD